jgi:hypothetical protein
VVAFGVDEAGGRTYQTLQRLPPAGEERDSGKRTMGVGSMISTSAKKISATPNDRSTLGLMSSGSGRALKQQVISAVVFALAGC